MKMPPCSRLWTTRASWIGLLVGAPDHGAEQLVVVEAEVRAVRRGIRVPAVKVLVGRERVVSRQRVHRDETYRRRPRPSREPHPGSGRPRRGRGRRPATKTTASAASTPPPSMTMRCRRAGSVGLWVDALLRRLDAGLIRHGRGECSRHLRCASVARARARADPSAALSTVRRPYGRSRSRALGFVAGALGVYLALARPWPSAGGESTRSSSSSARSPRRAGELTAERNALDNRLAAADQDALRRGAGREQRPLPRAGRHAPVGIRAPAQGLAREDGPAAPGGRAGSAGGVRRPADAGARRSRSAPGTSRMPFAGRTYADVGARHSCETSWSSQG